MAIPHGRWPTVTDPTASLVEVSIATTVAPRPVVTYTRRPSGATTTPIGRTFSPVSMIVLMTVWELVSTTETTEPFSDVTYARVPSGVNSDARGRVPTANCFNTFLVLVSMTET